MSREIFTIEYMVAAPLMDQMMTWVVIFSCVISMITLSYIWLKKRHWLFQPSLIIFAVICIRIQLPAVFYVRWATENLPSPWDFVLVTQFFPLGYLAVMVPLSSAKDAMLREFAARLKKQLLGTHAWPPRLTIFCLVMSILTIGLSCIYTPFTQSGLYAMLTDPTQVNAARAAIKQSVDSRIVAYVLGWGYYVFASLLVFSSVFVAMHGRRLILQSPWAIFCLLTGFMALTFTGNRGGLTMFALMIFVAYFCARQRMPSKIMLGLCAVFICAFPAFLSLAREGREWTLEKHFEYVNIIIMDRIVEVPDQVGMLYIYDAQTTGYSGISGFPLFALLTGQSGESLQTRIGNEYLSRGQYCNAMAVFEYYKMMGLFGIPVTIIGLLCLDLFLLFLRAPSVALLPFVIFFVSRALQGSETTVTVLLMTGGFWFVPLLAWCARIPTANNGNGYYAVQASSSQNARTRNK